MKASSDREFLHSLYLEGYGPQKVQQKEREVCIHCGLPRVLGQRGSARGKCKKCRKGE